MLILAAVCALPAVSAAQDSGSAPETTTTSSEPPAPAPPPDQPAAPAPAQQPGEPASSGGRSGGSGGGDATTNQSAATPSSSSTTTTNRSVARAHSSSTTTVSMEDFFFSPASVTVHVGDLVTWRNTGKEPHTATADDGSFDTGTVTAGGSASHMFTSAGTFTYVCTIHPNMKGTVRVLSSSGSGGSGGSAGSSSSGSSQSEASAVNSPDAAGDANTLPMTGLAAGAMALVGLGLLATGLIVRLSARKSATAGGGRQLRLF
jgi:plastocyanin